MNRKNRLRPALVLLVMLIGHTAGTGLTASTILTDLNHSLVDLANEIPPAIVQIISTGYGPTGDAGLSAAIFAQRTSSGSGVIVDSEGYIITNAHVVSGARQIRVILPVPSAEGSPARSILPSEGRTVGAQLVGLDLEPTWPSFELTNPTSPS